MTVSSREPAGSRPEAGGRAVTASGRARGGEVGRTTVVALVALVVVVGGLAGLLRSRGDDTAGGVAVPGGALVVEGVDDKTLDHDMPGMSMPDEVPVGMRRIAVRVSLVATGDEGLAHTSRDFTVSGPGVQPVVPVQSRLGEGVVPPGSTLSGTVSFDIPEETTRLDLHFKGGATAPLPALPAPPATQPHHPEGPAQTDVRPVTPAAGGEHAEGHPPDPGG